MLKEITVNLDSKKISERDVSGLDRFAKALAVRRIMESGDPGRMVYLTGFTSLTASGLGFAGKLGVYGISRLGGNLQGSRAGGLIAGYLTRHGIVGLRITGESNRRLVLVIYPSGAANLAPLSDIGENIRTTSDLADRLYKRFGHGLGLALSNPSGDGFLYGAVVTNTKPGAAPNRAAARGTTVFGSNGLVGVAVLRPPKPRHEMAFDRSALNGLLQNIHHARRKPGLTGGNDPNNPVLGGTYGSSAQKRFDEGLALTNLFRSADVPKEFYGLLRPDNIAREQVRLAAEAGRPIARHSCLPGCPNKCIFSQFVREGNAIREIKAGEWETVQGLINLGVFKNAFSMASTVLAHSNEYAYDHIEALTTVAALALVTEKRQDTGVRYGDAGSIMKALNEAASGKTDLGRLIRKGAAAVESQYGLERTFTIGGHALPFHNGRAVLQTGIGLSWTYGRHGETIAGPGRHNFLGQPYNATDHSLSPETHVLNAMHAMILFDAVDELGMCFFMGLGPDVLVDVEAILNAMGYKSDPRDLVRRSAQTLLNIHRFNAERGVHIQPLPRIFYETATSGNRQTPDRAVRFDIPFELIRDYGRKVLESASEGRTTIPDSVLNASRARYEPLRLEVAT